MVISRSKNKYEIVTNHFFGFINFLIFLVFVEILFVLERFFSNYKKKLFLL